MRAMSLKTKSLTILGAVVLLATTLNFGVLNYLVYPSFIELERVEAQRNLKRAQDAIQNEISHLSRFVWDWAAWDDTYEFIENPAQKQKKYVDSNLVDSAFTGNNLNLIMYYNKKGILVWGKSYDLALKKERALEEMPSVTLSPTHSLLNHSTVKSAPKGVMLTNRGPMLIASRPIATSEEKGPIRGTIVMGKFLSGPVIKTLKEQTQVEFQIWPLDKRPSTPNEQAALAQFETGKKIVLRETGNDVLAAYSQLLDYENKSAVLLRTDTPRSISAVGVQTLEVALLGILAAGLISLIVLAVLQGRLVTGPLIRLTDHVLAIGSSGDLSKRLSLKRTDEIGTLAIEFDRMLDNLADARRRLLEQSYNSGLAEMATGILHNVRNQMAPLVLRVGRLTSDLATVPGANAAKVVAELADGGTPAKRRKKLSEYIGLTVDEFVTDREVVAGGLQEITGGLGRIEEILAHHEEVSHAERAIESIRLAHVIEDAMKSLPADPKFALSVAVDPEIESLESVRAERIVLLQVLENVLRNAVAAVEDAGRTDANIHFSATPAHQDGQAMVHLRIDDNGSGMDAETLERIFERGFTTKPGGKGGLGLHWCANSMASMGGRIHAESDGPGQGATFHIMIPAFAQSAPHPATAPSEPQDAVA